ncbi:MAG TPA: hypothetical protein VFB72_19370 [Verrucomicrobiae bacterium]|nr:hypothetical protein [Verrucomicrobiae bacterium]
MNPLEEAHYDPEQLAALAANLVASWEAGDEEIRDTFPAKDSVEAEKLIADYVRDMGSEVVFKNDVYQVAVRRPSERTLHLSIKRIDRQCIHDWRDLQEIKNQLVGEECEAVELYPAESRRIDAANQYHLWCSTDPQFRFPVGFNQGRLVTEKSINGSVNRPFEPKEKS